MSSPLSNRNLEFIVLSCDRIVDIMADEEVVKFLRFRVSYGMNDKRVRTSEQILT